MKTPAFWNERTFKAQMLRPISWLYQAGRRVHRAIRQQHIYYASVPVISVGNITAGGTGKTPFIQHLAKHFAENGDQVAILSRGYGGTHTTPLQVTPETSPQEAGDEPVMLAQKLASLSVHVWVGKNRKILAQRAERAGATLLLLDDGFQRDDMARTVNIVMMNGENPFGNGLCLPAGPLREPLSALQRADFGVVINAPKDSPLYYHVPAYRLETAWPQNVLKNIQHKKIIAFTGLGNPERFFNQLAAHKLNIVQTYAFPDHHFYTEEEWTSLTKEATASKAQLVTTEKDSVRLTPTQQKDLTSIPLTLEGEDWENILAEIEQKRR